MNKSNTSPDHPSHPPPSPSPPFIYLLFIFLLILSLYLLTVYPSLTGGDSGELLLTVCNLGIAHPPGYPTYTIIGYVWSYIIWPTFLIPLFPSLSLAHIAYRVNCLCCLEGAIAGAAIAYTTVILCGRVGISMKSSSSSSTSNTIYYLSLISGLFSSIGFSFMPTVWLYSIQAEVFALNNMFVSLLIALTVKYYMLEERVQYIESLHRHIGSTKKQEDSSSSSSSSSLSSSTSSSDSADSSSSPLSPSLPPRNLSSLLTYAYIGATLCGLCLTNQHTTVFPVIITSGFITYSLFNNNLLTLARVFYLIFFVLLGLSPYLYIILRSFSQVEDSWGDQRTISGFLIHLLRQEYGTFQLAASEISKDPGMKSRLIVYIDNMIKESGGTRLLPIASTIGLFTSLCSRSHVVKNSSIVLGCGYIVYVLVFHYLANLDLTPLFLGVQARFWQQANIYVWIFAGISMGSINDALQWGERKFRGEKGDKAEKEKKYNGNDRKKNIQEQDNTLTPSSSTTSSISYSSLIFSLVAGLCTCLYLTRYISSNYSRYNHSENYSFYNYGFHLLQSFPQDSIILLNGDLNNNLLKYSQVCEKKRQDLSLLSLQLMSWEWFVPMQKKNYPKVHWPGNRYHVNTPGSFNIKKFLDYNIKYFNQSISITNTTSYDDNESKSNKKKKTKKTNGGIYLCGPFKEGDLSNNRSPSGSLHYYDDIPYGICNYLVPYQNRLALAYRGSVQQATNNHNGKLMNEKENLPPIATESSSLELLEIYYSKGINNLPPFKLLPKFNKYIYTEDTWEYVLYKDNCSKLLHLSSLFSYYSSSHPQSLRGLELAYNVTNIMFEQEDLFEELDLIGPTSKTKSEYEYRSAGVIYGMYGKYMKDEKEKLKYKNNNNLTKKEKNKLKMYEKLEYESNHKMWLYWAKLLHISFTSSSSSSTPLSSHELYPYIHDRVNPYSSTRIEGIEQSNVIPKEWVIKVKEMLEKDKEREMERSRANEISSNNNKKKQEKKKTTKK